MPCFERIANDIHSDQLEQVKKKVYLETLKVYHLLFVGSSTLSKSWCVPHVGQFYCFKNQRRGPGRTVAAQIWAKFFRTHHFVPWQNWKQCHRRFRKSGGIAYSNSKVCSFLKEDSCAILISFKSVVIYAEIKVSENDNTFERNDSYLRIVQLSF